MATTKVGVVSQSLARALASDGNVVGKSAHENPAGRS